MPRCPDARHARGGCPEARHAGGWASRFLFWLWCVLVVLFVVVLVLALLLALVLALAMLVAVVVAPLLADARGGIPRDSQHEQGKIINATSVVSALVVVVVFVL